MLFRSRFVSSLQTALLKVQGTQNGPDSSNLHRDPNLTPVHDGAMEFDVFWNKITAGVELQQVCGCALTEPPIMGKLLGRETEIINILKALSITRATRKSYSVQTAAPPGAGKSALLQHLVKIFLDTDSRSGFELFFQEKNASAAIAASATSSATAATAASATTSPHPQKRDNSEDVRHAIECSAQFFHEVKYFNPTTLHR